MPKDTLNLNIMPNRSWEGQNKLLMKRDMLEIMAPAGNFECLHAAIQGGADSVYFGGPIQQTISLLRTSPKSAGFAVRMA